MEKLTKIERKALADSISIYLLMIRILDKRDGGITDSARKSADTLNNLIPKLCLEDEFSNIEDGYLNALSNT